MFKDKVRILDCKAILGQITPTQSLLTGYNVAVEYLFDNQTNPYYIE